MFTVYVLKGASGRHYIGQTNDLDVRLGQHSAGQTYTTRRLGGSLELIASREFSTREEALRVERMLKRWKNPAKTIAFLQGSAEEISPDKSGLVAGSIPAPGTNFEAAASRCGFLFYPPSIRGIRGIRG